MLTKEGTIFFAFLLSCEIALSKKESNLHTPSECKCHAWVEYSNCIMAFVIAEKLEGCCRKLNYGCFKAKYFNYALSHVQYQAPSLKTIRA